MTQNHHRVLIIEDERRYRELLELNLGRRGYQVGLAPDGLSGLNLFERNTPDLVILDLMLPDIEGYEVCRRIREHSQVPIIILTARAEEADKVRGLGLGADDYVTKPFGPEELLARVDAVLRRSRARADTAAPAHFVNGDLAINFVERRVTVRGREVHLGPTEYKLLYHLALNVGRTLVHEELLRRVWGLGYEQEAPLLHTAIRRLRHGIEENPRSPRYVLSRRGIGYLLAPAERE